MEDLSRLVSDSLARHGFVPHVDYRRLEWSQWQLLESSFSVMLAPGKPGLFALAEEIFTESDGENTRTLKVFRIAQSDDIGMNLGCLFLPGIAESNGLLGKRCYARYAVIEDPEQRNAACNAWQQWLKSSEPALTSDAKG